VGQTFVDSIIRAGVPFQLSRLVTPMLRACSNAAGLGAGGYDGTGCSLPEGVRLVTWWTILAVIK
jgi:hypothetical protein